MTAPWEAFLTESNRIEGIHRGPTHAEAEAFMQFYFTPHITVDELCRLQAVFAPDCPLRTEVGMDVQVGNHVAPRGGSNIRRDLAHLIERLPVADPWRTHCAFETLHPFMDGNGRTGRMLWAWHMASLGQDPFALPFLHRFYYQTLENADGRK